MKIRHFFGLAVIAAMTASCSSNEDLGTAGKLHPKRVKLT